MTSPYPYPMSRHSFWERFSRVSAEARRAEKQAAVDAANEIVDDFFAFQAAACTTRPDCKCGGKRHV